MHFLHLLHFSWKGSLFTQVVLRTGRIFNIYCWFVEKKGTFCWSFLWNHFRYSPGFDHLLELFSFFLDPLYICKWNLHWLTVRNTNSCDIYHQMLWNIFCIFWVDIMWEKSIIWFKLVLEVNYRLSERKCGFSN